jgi:hypothetical protein
MSVRLGKEVQALPWTLTDVSATYVGDEAAKQPGSTVGPARYVVFAQLFWSNQSDNYDDRLHPDDKAFRPDRKTGEIDMSSYKYHAQSRIKKDAITGAETRTSYVNFDYGFWDEASSSF